MNHPNLLMLLGVCQTQQCDAISLVYERVELGSLYSVLHDQRLSLSDKFKTAIVIQICGALEYVHSLGIVHCAVTSHSVVIVNKRQAKLTCFEYALPNKSHSEEPRSWRHPILTSDAHLNVLRHWMAPEVLLKQRFSVRADIYSLACVMWELCREEIPWQDFSLSALRKLFSETKDMLPANTPSKYWNRVLEVGLKVNKSDRDLEIEEILYMMNKTKQSAPVSNNEIVNGFNGSRKTSGDSIASSKKFPEIESADNGYFDRKYGHLHRTTSFSSLQSNTSLSSLQNNRERGDSCFYTNTTPRRRLNEMTPPRSPKTLPRPCTKTTIPGILKFDNRHDFELKAQHTRVTEEFKQVLEAKRRRDVENEKLFYEQRKLKSNTLPHPKIKPASHFLEGVPSAVIPNLSKIWKHVPVAKDGDGDRIFSAAIKPAGHALCLQKRSQSALDISIRGAAGQKLRSMRRCYSYSRMPNELREAVFQPQRYFSQPADFQRQRGPWAPLTVSQKSDLDKKKGSSDSIPLERDNPFIPQQRPWHSQEISRPLSPNRLNDSLGEFQSQMKSSNVLHSTPGGDKGLIDFGVRLKSVQKKLEMGDKVVMEDKIIQTDNNNHREEAETTTPADTASVHPCTTTSTVTATTSSSNTTSPTTSTTTTNDKKDGVLPSSSDDVVIDSSGTSSSDGQKSFEVHKETVEGGPEDAAHTSYIIQTGKASEKHPTIQHPGIRNDDNIKLIVENDDDNVSELGEYDEEEEGENDYLQVEEDEGKEEDKEIVLAVNIDDDDDANDGDINNKKDKNIIDDEDGSRETDMFQTCPHLPPDTEEQ